MITFAAGFVVGLITGVAVVLLLACAATGLAIMRGLNW